MAGVKALGVSLRASHQLHTITSSSLSHSWAPLSAALGGHDPSEPLELQPHPWVRGVKSTLARCVNGLFGIAGACLEGERHGGDITGSMGTWPTCTGDRSGIWQFINRGSTGGAAPAVCPQPEKWDKPAPTGHQGHGVPTAEQAGETEGSSRRRGGKGTQWHRGVGTGKRDPTGVAAPAPALAPVPFGGLMQ